MKIKGLKGSKYIFLLAFMIFSFNFITATSIYDDCNIYGNCEEVDIGNTLGDLSCSAGQIPKYNISLGGWYCASDEIGEAGTGDITAVYTGSNLTGGGNYWRRHSKFRYKCFTRLVRFNLCKNWRFV